MPGKNLVLELNAKMVCINQIAEFLNFNISKTIGGIKFIFLHASTHLLTLQIDDVILYGRGQACTGMPREAAKTLRSQKLKEVQS